MIPLFDFMVWGVIVTLILDFTVDYIDNRISRMCPEQMGVNQPSARMVEVHDFFTLPLQK